MSQIQDSDYLTYHGKLLISSHHESHSFPNPGPTFPSEDTASILAGDAAVPLSNKEPLIPRIKDHNVTPVGIIGSGVGGLYAALMLKSIGIPFEILEASDRVGGRLYTRRLPDTTDPPKNKNDYFDVGAMRFPQTSAMSRVFHLFDYLKLSSKLIPYHFSSPNTTLQYNGRPAIQLIPGGPTAKTTGHNVPREWRDKSPGDLVDSVMEPFAAKLREDLMKGGTNGWKELMKYDNHSVRSYMMYVNDPKFPVEVVNWLETMWRSTGWFDRALSEAVVSYLAFNYQTEAKLDWVCFDGGSHVLTDAMAAATTSNKKNEVGPGKAPSMRSAVTRIVPNLTRSKDHFHLPEPPSEGPLPKSEEGVPVPEGAGSTSENTFRRRRPPPRQVTSLTLSIDGKGTREYQHVISTVSLPCLRAINLEACKLTIDQSNSIRQLQYGPAVKIGVRFRTNWWKNTPNTAKFFPPFGPISGGESCTDRPVRDIVYPSNGEGTDTPSNVLIASYSLMHDALILVSLMNDPDPRSKIRLQDLVLRDLVAVHNLDPVAGLKFLQDQVADFSPYSWGNNQWAGGAFAWFGPTQFSSIYRCMTLPAAGGLLHFAGEALSMRHGWVAGALDSAWRAVREIVATTYPQKTRQFIQEWGQLPEWTGKEIPNAKFGGLADLELKVPETDADWKSWEENEKQGILERHVLLGLLLDPFAEDDE